MGSTFWTALIGGVALAGVAGILWRHWRTAQMTARRRLAMLEFADRADELGAEFLLAARATGKPRGLRWTSCEMQDRRRFAQDQSTGELVALAAVAIGFEAIAGGGMEDVEAVGNIRLGTAVFFLRNGHWQTDGRAVFNLDPDQTLQHYEGMLEPMETADA